MMLTLMNFYHADPESLVLQLLLVFYGSNGVAILLNPLKQAPSIGTARKATLRTRDKNSTLPYFRGDVVRVYTFP